MDRTPASQRREHTAPSELNVLCRAVTTSTGCHSVSSELLSSTQTHTDTHTLYAANTACTLVHCTRWRVAQMPVSVSDAIDLVVKRSSQDVHVDSVIVEQKLHDAVCQRRVESTARCCYCWRFTVHLSGHLSTARQTSASSIYWPLTTDWTQHRPPTDPLTGHIMDHWQTPSLDRHKLTTDHWQPPSLDTTCRDLWMTLVDSYLVQRLVNDYCRQLPCVGTCNVWAIVNDYCRQLPCAETGEWLL